LQHEPERQLLGARSLPLGCNAPSESFFHTLKMEFTHHRRYQTREEAKQEIFEYIEVFYNRQKRHSTIGYQTPSGYEKENRKVV